MYSSEELKEIRKRERIREKRVRKRQRADMLTKSRQNNQLSRNERIPFAIFCTLIIGAVTSAALFLYKNHKDKYRYKPQTQTAHSTQRTAPSAQMQELTDKKKGKSESKRKYDELIERKKRCKGLTNPISKHACYCFDAKGNRLRRFCRKLDSAAKRYSEKRNAAAKRRMRLY
jgi:hypothetical protein